MTYLQSITLSSHTLLNIQWLSASSAQFLTQFAFDIIAVFILIRIIYFRHYRRTDHFLTFFGFNVIIFLLTYLLNKVEMSMGAAFGLFAVFSMLRYRTEGISTKDMTYLFIVIAIGLISAISKNSWEELLFTTTILLLITALLEGSWLIKKEHTKVVTYDKIGLISPANRELLIEDLSARTGLNIHRVEIQDYDFLKDSVQLIMYYYEK
ncbi:DUF4956 domain-containing protein [Arcicella sp. LKC2W]|uniref:DUF4956 domain-containing protein n=1 Tax=Arcicella sp. LKC2W TaxID=2984198 RepID=UPI002B217A68|nr:DUF4956 domain-containing protein [Arcicella sp. LKC2W]MEA5458412.1 DUF4956 domain-containing protein [Arcicella sp. LKC2W]